MFEKLIQNLESVILLTLKHHLCCATTDLNCEVCAAIPGVDLAHAGEIEAGDGRLNRRDVLRVVDQGNRLSIARPE